MLLILRKNIIFVVIFVIILVICVALLLSPSSKLSGKPESNQKYQVLPSDFPAKQNVDVAITDLTKKLPYKSTYFSLSYDPSTFQYTLTFDKNHQVEGNKQFDDFLTSQGISNRDGFKKLKIVQQ